MLNIGMSVLSISVSLIIWLIVTILIMIAIKFNESKKSRQKIMDEYPYFNYPIYKKIFFTGLKGAIPIFITILSYIVNVMFIILFAFFLWNVISANLVASYVLRIGGVIFLLLNIIRLIVVYCTKIKL